jgi:hypothetical protein
MIYIKLEDRIITLAKYKEYEGNESHLSYMLEYELRMLK